MPDGKERELPWWETILRATVPPYGAIAPFARGEMLLPWQQPTQAAQRPAAQLGPAAFGALATLTPEERAELAPIPKEPLAQRIARRKRDEEKAKLAAAELGKPKPIPPQPTQPPPEGFRWAFDRDLNRWVPQFSGLSAQQQAQQELSQQQLALQREQFEFKQQPAPISPLQEQQFGLQQQAQQQAQAQFGQQFGLQQQQFQAGQQQFQQQLQFQQEQALLQADLERQREQARLAANPMSWLQYASFTGEAPLTQPWMIPLGQQGGEQLQVGQPLIQGEQTFADLPQLTTPSAQLQARWGPTAQQQFLGFRQARTGATPQETQFRLGSQRAPTGSFGGFSRFR